MNQGFFPNPPHKACIGNVFVYILSRSQELFSELEQGYKVHEAPNKDYETLRRAAFENVAKVVTTVNSLAFIIKNNNAHNIASYTHVANIKCKIIKDFSYLEDKGVYPLTYSYSYYTGELVDLISPLVQSMFVQTPPTQKPVIQPTIQPTANLEIRSIVQYLQQLLQNVLGVTDLLDCRVYRGDDGNLEMAIRPALLAFDLVDNNEYISRKDQSFQVQPMQQPYSHQNIPGGVYYRGQRGSL